MFDDGKKSQDVIKPLSNLKKLSLPLDRSASLYISPGLNEKASYESFQNFDSKRDRDDDLSKLTPLKRA